MFNFLKRYKDEVIETNNASHEDTRNEMMKWMKSIDEACWDTKRRLEAIEAFCQAMFPSDNDSIQQRKRENLAKIYARHLIEKEKLSPKDALIRAKFEILKFDNDKILDDINQEIKNREAKIAEDEYYSSKVIEGDIKNFWTTGDTRTNEHWIAPYDLFAPIYSLMKNRNWENNKTVSVGWESDQDYYSFIRNRAIIRNLENLGILSKVTDNKRPRNIENQDYKFNTTDLNKIGEIIYKGPRQYHDDKFFDERLAENKLENIFRMSV